MRSTRLKKSTPTPPLGIPKHVCCVYKYLGEPNNRLVLEVPVEYLEVVSLPLQVNLPPQRQVERVLYMCIRNTLGTH